MNEIPHPGFNKPEEYETFTTTNGLEDAAEKHLDTMFGRGKHQPFYKDLFIAGAKWQAEQLLKSSPLPEDTVLFNKGVAEGRRLEREENLDLDIVFWKGIQYAKEQMLKDGLDAVKTLDFNKVEKTIAGVFVDYGMRRQKEQMMKDAVEGELMLNPYPIICLDDCKNYDFKEGDKVRVIVIPNTDEK